MAYDDPFYTLLPAPPLGKFDPCYQTWKNTCRLAWERAMVCRMYGDDSPSCQAAQERYFEAARRYSACLDDTWGQNEF
ncbi:hypothetical protein [Effusibacillus dendaii]|uniref:Uncharacterized protein n=1 Tax=Effusibacillus dendaii TaxID=2743772 RepID=A0A7I8D969_9BACL|nr:hypothetical protein [Effusibacillus dendaii]BCJ86664.1 hypothetical protein skT53_16490 [Effusibacillus dendaii]